MNILILVKTLTFGGAERVASLWANGFANHGHNVCVCTCRRDNVPDTYQVNKNIKRFNIYSWLLPKFSRIGIHPMAKKLKPIIDKVDPDVIICVQGHWAEWAYKATRSSRIPIINTEHNSFERPIYAPMPRKIWRAKFIENKRYSAVTVLTEADSRCIGNRLNNVFVLPNPLTYSPLTDIPPKEKIILAAGRFDVWHYKGFDLLIKAWGMIAPKNKEWTLYMCLLKDDWLLKY